MRNYNVSIVIDGRDCGSYQLIVRNLARALFYLLRGFVLADVDSLTITATRKH